MKVSIITSVYNNAHYITDAVESVVSQDYPDIEYIVIDGASTDGTIEKLKDKSKYIDTFISEPDKGIYDGLNKGIKNATGDIVGFMHSDDLFFSSSSISSIVELFQKHGCDAVYSDLLFVDKTNINKVIRNWKSKPFTKNLLKRGWMPAHPTLYLKRAIYEKYGNFDTSFKIAADYDFMLRVLSQDIRVEYLPQVTIRMRVGGASNSIGNIRQKMAEDLRALKKNNVGGIFTLGLKNISKIPQFFS